MKRLFLAAIAALGLLPLSASAQSVEPRIEAVLVDEYDVPADGYTYVVFADRNAAIGTQPLAGALGRGTDVNIPVKTVASSTTITAVTAGTAPFDNMVAGDLLIFDFVKAGSASNTADQREVVIVSVTSDDEVVVSAVINLSDRTAGYKFRMKKRYSSTSADRVYFDTSMFTQMVFQADVETLSATSLDFIVECRARKYGLSFSDSTWTKNFTAAGSAQVVITSRQEQCRVGWAFNTDTGVSDVATHFLGVAGQ